MSKHSRVRPCLDSLTAALRHPASLPTRFTRALDQVAPAFSADCAATRRLDALLLHRRSRCGLTPRVRPVLHPRDLWPRSAFQLQVADAVTGSVVHDSGLVNASLSAYKVPKSAKLEAGGRYTWRVRIVSSDNEDGWSAPEPFVAGEGSQWTAPSFARIAPSWP